MAVSQSLTLTQSSTNVSNNTSQVRILWTSTQTSTSYNGYTRTAKYYVSINGGAAVSYSVSYTLPKNTTVTLLDTTITVPHNTDGSATVKVTTWMDTDISAGVIEQTKTLNLTPIPKATTPTFHAGSVDMGGTLTIYLNRASTSFTHDLAYSFAGGAYVDIVTGATTVHYWAVPDLAEQIPNAASVTVTVRCITKNGSTVVGTKTAIFTAKVPASVVPTISSVTASEATAGIYARFGAYVKGHSTLAVSVAAAGVKGSTIKSYTTTIDGRNYSGASFTSQPLLSSGTVNLVTTVTDSRGRSAKKTTTISALDYHLPETTEFTARRVDANGAPKNDGQYVSVTYAYNVAPVGNKNTASMKIEYRRSTATSWSGPLMTSAALSGSGDRKFNTVLSSDYQYDIRLTVEDWFGEVAEYTATLPTANVIMDIKAAGDGLAFGKTAEFPGFEMDMPAAGESFKMLGVKQYELGSGYGHILYNNGLLLQWGSVSVTPTAINTVTTLTVAFPIPYVTRPHITGTILVSSPEVVSWSMGVGTSEYAAVSSLVFYMRRSTLHATPFRWMAIGLADMTEVD